MRQLCLCSGESCPANTAHKDETAHEDEGTAINARASGLGERSGAKGGRGGSAVKKGVVPCEGVQVAPAASIVLHTPASLPEAVQVW